MAFVKKFERRSGDVLATLTGSPSGNGATGPTGPSGPTGLTGATGAIGLSFTGPTGPTGIGATGPSGQSIRGPTGPQGYQGPTGAAVTGPTGFGATGPTGIIGATGPTGIAGATGAIGPQGNFGGATFDYTFDDSNSPEVPSITGQGQVRLNQNNGTQKDSTEMYISSENDSGDSIANFMTTISSVSSTIKGFVRVTTKTDSAVFIVFQITDISEIAGSPSYYNININSQSSSSDNPFSNNDDMLVSFVTNGNKGDQGVTGPTGPTGQDGAIGATGPTGEDGAVGATGPTGLAGENGDVGSTGPTGASGENGDVGATGPTGVAGEDGDVGATGPAGEDGAVGATGPTGVAGEDGAVGATGPTGAIGPQGNFGGATFDYTFNDSVTPTEPTITAQGEVRLNHNSGTQKDSTEMYISSENDSGDSISSFMTTISSVSSAIKGFVRITEKTDSTDFIVFQITNISEIAGSPSYYTISINSQSSSSDIPFSNNDDMLVSFITNGNKGDQGPIGATGPAGENGQDGAVGPTGAAGENGQNGDVGATGPAGENGQDGAVGATGPAGENGEDGAVGPTGAAGENGQDGAVGPTGAAGQDGQDGAVGATGPAGENGQDGQDGAVGATGPTGEAGENGQDGAVGATGPTGESGENGQDGDVGATGPTGESGQDGSTGATGPTGAIGPQGNFGGATFDYTFNDSVSPTDPTITGQGQVRLNQNSGTQKDSTEMYISSENDNGDSISSFMTTISSVSSTIKGFVRITEKTDSTDFIVFQITNISEVAGTPSYYTIDITSQSSSADVPFSNYDDMLVSFITNGNKGDQGSIGATGPTGQVGPTGPMKVAVGPTGPAGEDGTVGATGPAGENGQDGAVGATGPAGENGQNGQDGAVGATGPAGVVSSGQFKWSNWMGQASGFQAGNMEYGGVAAYGEATQLTFHKVDADGVDQSTFLDQYLNAKSGQIKTILDANPSHNNVYQIVGASIDGAGNYVFDVYNVSYDDIAVTTGSTEVYFVLVGAEGPQGPTGPTGEDGAIGATGPTGEDGAIGATGPAGEDGTSGSKQFAVTNSGSGAYTIDGAANPTLYLLRGFTYTFNINATNHPFFINTSSSTGTANQYNNGITGNGTQVGTLLFSVPFDAPATLYYNCQYHISMAGTINISDVGPTGPTGPAGSDSPSGVAIGNSTSGSLGATQDITSVYFESQDFSVNFSNDSAIITSTNTVNGVPIALRQETEFSLDPTISNGDWVTIAQAGVPTDHYSLRTDGLFQIFENQLTHHHSIVFRAGGKFTKGFYINVLSSSWFSSPSITALRIASLGTFDGFVLQAQFEAPNVTNPAQKYYLKLYENQNNDGWTNLINGESVSPTNAPTVYVTNTPSNPTGTPYTNFKVCDSLDFDPLQQNSMAATTQDYLFNGGYIDVRGGKLEVNNANIEMGTGDKIITGLVEATSGTMSVTADSNLTLAGGADTTIGAGGRASGQIGNAILDANGDVVIAAGVTKNGGFKSDGKVDIAAVNQVMIHGDSSSDATLPDVVIGDANNQHHTHVQEPLRLLNTNYNDINSQLTQIGNPEGTIAYLSGGQGPIMQIGQYRRILTTSSTLVNFIGSLSARTHATLGSYQAQTIESNTGSGQSYRFHMANRGYGATSGHLSLYGSTRELCVSHYPHEIKVYSATLYPFSSYIHNPIISLTGSSASISWEIWVATTTSSTLYDSVLDAGWFNNSWITNAGVPTKGSNIGAPSGITNNRNYTWDTDGCVCQRIAKTSLNISSSSTDSIYNPWSSPTFASASSDSNPVTLSFTPFVIPTSTNFSLYLIERAESTSGNTLKVNFHGTSNRGYRTSFFDSNDAVPLEISLHGVSWLPIS